MKMLKLLFYLLSKRLKRMLHLQMLWYSLMLLYICNVPANCHPEKQNVTCIVAPNCSL